MAKDTATGGWTGKLLRVDLSAGTARSEAIPEGARDRFEEENALEMAIYRYALANWGNSS